MGKVQHPYVTHLGRMPNNISMVQFTNIEEVRSIPKLLITANLKNKLQLNQMKILTFCKILASQLGYIAVVNSML